MQIFFPSPARAVTDPPGLILSAAEAATQRLRALAMRRLLWTPRR